MTLWESGSEDGTGSGSCSIEGSRIKSVEPSGCRRIVKVNVKLSLCLIKYHAMKTYGGSHCNSVKTWFWQTYQKVLKLWGTDFSSTKFWNLNCLTFHVYIRPISSWYFHCKLLTFVILTSGNDHWSCTCTYACKVYFLYWNPCISPVNSEWLDWFRSS
jgi:hypothetical protein